MNKNIDFKFSYKYMLLAIALFLIEIMIGTIGKNIYWLRAFGGDVLVVILLYTIIRTFVYMQRTPLVVGIFLFSVIVECLQYIQLATKLGFKPGSVMYIVLGNSFSWGDIVCYAIGCTLIMIMATFKN